MRRTRRLARGKKQRERNADLDAYQAKGVAEQFRAQPRAGLPKVLQ